METFKIKPLEWDTRKGNLYLYQKEGQPESMMAQSVGAYISIEYFDLFKKYRVSLTDKFGKYFNAEEEWSFKTLEKAKDFAQEKVHKRLLSKWLEEV